MSHFAPLPTPVLPELTRKTIDNFLQSARSSFGENLRAAVLYGSAAEGKLRPTSDTNLILILLRFAAHEAESIRPALRLAESAIQLKVMFLLEEEIPAAVRSFAPKFSDVLRRRVILYGEDSFASISIPRGSGIRQLRQQLLNMTLRLRSVYAARGSREEQLGIFLANTLGTLRILAQTLLELREMPASSPQEAFQRVGAELELSEWGATLRSIETIQSAHIGEPGTIPRVFLQVLDCVEKMRAKSETLGEEARHESI